MNKSNPHSKNSYYSKIKKVQEKSKTTRHIAQKQKTISPTPEICLNSVMIKVSKPEEEEIMISIKKVETNEDKNEVKVRAWKEDEGEAKVEEEKETAPEKTVEKEEPSEIGVKVEGSTGIENKKSQFSFEISCYSYIH